METNNSQFSTTPKSPKGDYSPPLGGGGYSQLIRVSVVDDHQIVIDGLEKIIAESGIACLTGKSCNVAGCWKMLSA